MEQSEAAFREIALRVNPDLILLQELPRLVPFVETHGMVRANPESHSGNLATLVRLELMLQPPEVNTVDGCAILTTFGGELTVANVHLAPGAGKAAQGARLEQLAEIVESSPTERLVIIGDTNTRVDEVATLEAADLRGDRPPRATWDSQQNRFNSGPHAKEFRAFFTRHLASPGVRVGDVSVLADPLEADGAVFHISDHYGLSGMIHLG